MPDPIPSSTRMRFAGRLRLNALLGVGLVSVVLTGACNFEGTAPEIGSQEDAETAPSLDAQPLIITAIAMGDEPRPDLVYTRGPMFATLQVANPHGTQVGHLDVTIAYAFTEISDSVEFVANGVFRLGDPEIAKPAAFGTVTVRVGPEETATVEVLLGTPRSLTEMSATRHFFLTDANVTALRTVTADSLNAGALIRTATNERVQRKLTDFGHLGLVFGGVVLPAIVPVDVRLVGATLTGTDVVGTYDEPVWGFTKPANTAVRIEFDVFNQAPFTVPAGVPYAIWHDADQPLITEQGTVWPQVTVAQGTTSEAIPPGGTLTIDTGVSSDFSGGPGGVPEYVVITDIRSLARVYPIILNGRPVRAWFNVHAGSAEGR